MVLLYSELATSLLAEFNAQLNVNHTLDRSMQMATDNFLKSLSNCDVADNAYRIKKLYFHITEKFDLNKDVFNNIMSYAATNQISFNYHEKCVIKYAINSCDANKYKELISQKTRDFKTINELTEKFSSKNEEYIRNFLKNELESPTLTRKDSKAKDRSREILDALFGAYVYSSYDERDVHIMNTQCGNDYKEDFWEYLHGYSSNLFSRKGSLIVYNFDESTIKMHSSYSSLLACACNAIKSSYEIQSNHGILAIVIDNSHFNFDGLTWQLCEDIILFAERFKLSDIKNNYFKPKEIESITKQYICGLDSSKALFEKVNTGYFYRDTFVVQNSDNYKLVLVFQKNEPDEKLIPCPACRSALAQGNSYSSLGVKSWECKNLICPDRSKFNRGKRYSFYQLLMQQSLKTNNATIGKDLVRRWSRDVIKDASPEEIGQMLIKFFSLPGDEVLSFNFHFSMDLERKIVYQKIPSEFEQDVFKNFADGPFFSRFIYNHNDVNIRFTDITVGKARLYLGESRAVLKSFESNSIDGAVTSPPYYNAREYAQWSNIYCYLYDMYNINKEVFRVLRPGAVYLYNIFNYFDNENNIAFSALGKRRLALSAYTVNLFNRAGFILLGNIVWDKGEIEGKRGFNGGNYSPYYQAPFNCWEHILVFQKPGNSYYNFTFPPVLKLKPVLKMFNGENKHGHTAPFPEEIPALLIKQLPEDGTILDPFGGSMTTSIAANRYAKKSICIERLKEYFTLGVNKLNESDSSNSLLKLLS